MKRINLIPQEKRVGWRYRKDSPHLVLISLSIFLVITAAQFLDSVRLKVLISSRQRKIVSLDKESDKHQALYNKVKREREALIESQKRIEEKILVVRRIKQDALRWSVILEEVAKLTPLDVTLNILKVNKDAITIDAATLDNLAVSRFMQSLDDSGNFKNTNFSYTRKEKLKNKKGEEYEVINFGITTYLEKYYGL